VATISVDFDVFKALTTLRMSEEQTENDVLRKLLGLPDGVCQSAVEQ
jgi:predicted CopG family antitoxin